MSEAWQYAARIWAHRAAAEVAAAGRFERLSNQLSRTGAQDNITALAAEAASDEIRHHERCAALARHFGARGELGNAADPPPVHFGTTDPRDQLLVELVAMSCITESLSAALLLQIKERATEDRVREVAQEVVRDEVAHARLGWAYLATRAAAGDVSFLSPLIPRMLETTVEEEIFGEDEPHTDLARELSGLGGLPRRLRREVFLATLDEVVFPGLRLHGVHTGEAERWVKQMTGAD